MSALEAILLRDHVLASEKLGEAKALQNEQGGNLDTAILELGFLAENVVHAYCAAVYGVTPATRSEVMNASYDVVRTLTREFSVRHRAIPVANNGSSLVVVVDRLIPDEILNQIRKELKYEPVQRMVATVRMEAGLAQHYGVELSARMRHLVDRLDMRDPGVVPYIVRFEGKGVRSVLPTSLTVSRPLRASSVPAAPLVEVTATRSSPGMVRNVAPRAGIYSARPVAAEVLGRTPRSSLPQPKPKSSPLIESWRTPGNESAAPDLSKEIEKELDQVTNGHAAAPVQSESEGPPTARITPLPHVLAEPLASIVVTPSDAVNGLIQGLTTASPDRAKQFIDELVATGESALPALVSAFPGAVRSAPDPNSEPLFESASLSNVFSAFLAFGKDALPYACSLLSHEDPQKRYYAILLLMRLDGKICCSKVWKCVFDADEHVSKLALRVMSHVPAQETQLLEQVLEQVRVALRVEGKEHLRLKAVQLLSELRDATAVRMLIETLEQTDDPATKEQTRMALVQITGQDFADKAAKWSAWYDKNHRSERISWLIAGLRNPDVSVRQRAVHELSKYSSDTFGYEAGASSFARKRAVRRWEAWYHERQKAS